jgi:hypothetical protein
LWSRHRRTLLRVLPIVALPIVFAFGFWARGVLGPEPGDAGIAKSGETASVGEGRSRPAAFLEQDGDQGRHKSVEESVLVARNDSDKAPAQADVGTRDEPRRIDTRHAPTNGGAEVEVRGRISHPQPGPELAAVQNNVNSMFGQQASHFPAANASGLADAFSLKAAGNVKQVSAEVIRPANAWFETAAEVPACTTGSCPAPVARLDRKLNTALEWSATPEAAAELAQRDGKLVFLIHVSGNFAQPGFT